MALRETIFVRDYPDEYLAREYATLTDCLLQAAEGDTGTALFKDSADFEKATGIDRLNTLLQAVRLASREEGMAFCPYLVRGERR